MMDCASTDFDETRARGLLDGAEEAALASLSRPARRREYLGGRLVAKSIAARLLGVEAESVRISVGEDGKPALPGGLALGIAHSGGLVLCAVAAPPSGGAPGGYWALGLDLEKAQPRENLAAMAAFAFSESERLAVRGDEEAFYAIWTLKEAALKRSGEGIAGLGGAPSFELGPAESLRVRSGDSAPRPEGCEFLCLGFGAEGAGSPPAFIASLAHGRSEPAPEAVFDEVFAPPPGLAVRTLFATSRAARL